MKYVIEEQRKMIDETGICDLTDELNERFNEFLELGDEPIDIINMLRPLVLQALEVMPLWIS